MNPLEEALHWVNNERGWRGLDPLAEMPKGVRRDACACPIAVALTVPGTVYCQVGVNHARWMNQYEDEIDNARLSHGASAFVVAFDDGRYPELVL